MKSIIQFSLNNKFAIWMMTIIITVAGLYAGVTMKQETLPNLDVPILTISTVYPGAAPQEVADKVSIPLEQRIKNLDGVDVVDSTSMENVSSIVVNYKYSKNIDKALTELREAISDLALPQGAQPAKVSKLSLNAFPVISLSISSKNQSLEEISKLIDTEIKSNLEGIAGIGTVNVSGEQFKEVALTLNQAKMKEMGLTEAALKGIVQASALKVPLGLFEMENSEKSIVVDGNITTLDDLKNIVITSSPKPGTISSYKLSEVATVELVGRADSISRTNGSPSVGIDATKSPDANTVTVVNAVKKQAELIKTNHPDVDVVTIFDQGKPIEESVSTMLTKALFGALFAVLIIMLFLRNIRTTIISIVSIPLSLLIAVLLLKQFNITLNTLTLGAMTVAIGRVVDDSIVVIENNYRRMGLHSEKLSGKPLVLDATREMFMPILSSTLVTIAVFLPLGTVSGPIGQLFLPFALTMVFALIASLLVAITVVPMLAHMMFRKGLKASQIHDETPGAIANFYRRVLRWTLSHKIITFIIAIVLLVSSLGLVKVVGTSFLPDQEDKYVALTYSPSPGKLLEDTKKTAMQAEEFILKRANVENLQYSVGGQSPFGGGGPNKGALFYVLYNTDTPEFAKESDLLIEELRKIEPTGKWAPMDFGGGIGGSKLSLSVYGDSLEEIKPAVEQIQGIMAKDKSFEKIETSQSKTYEQYTILADQAKLSKYGLTAGQIAMMLSPVRDRPALTEVKVEDKIYQVYVNVDQKVYGSIADIENATIQSPLGAVVPLKELVTVKEGTSASTVTRKDGRLFVSVSADITSKDVAKASSNLQKKVDELKLPASIKVDFGGVTEQITETFTQLGLAMAAAVAIVYLLLVITFGGALTPLAIIFSLPFMLIGALLGLYVAGETISAAAMMGALMLIGIVVTNAIVLLDRVRHKEQEGLSVREALIEAGGTRLRPILMTALATVGALLPLALGFESSGGIISKGLGVTVIGGLISSTLLTLIMVPIFYEFLARFRSKIKEESV
ncbi:efflux RND transporter permease subunit [Paenibacillus psychroresistens]|uniref:Efflux RND transporter permease subunit n=1 Tax=Paenibacillus psychroresistens TaxID=1778678 RepID=A0A6B8RDB7_9BACL|nr:efflux RND transporter permease subunit [Paenibacillus psychroresistens]QGQ94140.1 efflux RND transporter permease subunit [Paenibacillus psychroresistens]